MKVTRFDESNLFDDLDKIDAWVAERGFTQRNRLRIYRENLIAMRDTDDDMAAIHSQMQEAGRVNEMLASFVEGFELSDALKCLLDNKVATLYVRDQLRVPPVPRTWGPGIPPASIRQSINPDRSPNTPMAMPILADRSAHEIPVAMPAFQ